MNLLIENPQAYAAIQIMDRLIGLKSINDNDLQIAIDHLNPEQRVSIYYASTRLAAVLTHERNKFNEQLHMGRR